MRNSKSIFKEIGTILMIGLFLPIGQVFAQAVKNPKVVLITGAASGIGKATAIAFDKFMLRQFKVSTKKGESFYNAKSN